MAWTADIIRRGVDFALPPRCAACGAIVVDAQALCAGCWAGLDFLTGPGCVSCGVPIPADGVQCAPCMLRPPDHDGVRAAVVYGDVARTIVLRLKHGRRVALAQFIGGLMARTIVPSAEMLLVPVPLHRWRLWSRGFNQSQALAQVIGAASGLAIKSDALLRRRRTPVLGGLGAAERTRALAGAFVANPAAQDMLQDRPVMLVDDVYTSGATANACARTLKRAGASSVTVVCWARVLRGD